MRKGTCVVLATVSVFLYCLVGFLGETVEKITNAWISVSCMGVAYDGYLININTSLCQSILAIVATTLVIAFIITAIYELVGKLITKRKDKHTQGSWQ